VLTAKKCKEIEHVQAGLRSSWLFSQCAHAAIPLEALPKPLLGHIILEILHKDCQWVPIWWTGHGESTQKRAFQNIGLSPDATIHSDSTWRVLILFFTFKVSLSDCIGVLG